MSQSSDYNGTSYNVLFCAIISTVLCRNETLLPAFKYLVQWL